MKITAELSIGATVTKTVETADDAMIDSSDARIKATLEEALTLNATSTPDCEMEAHGSFAMTAGAATIDFTDLHSFGESISFSGKKVRFVVLQNPATNANSITIVEGASNGLSLLGANFSVTLAPGETIAKYLPDGPTVGGSDKTIDITGTGSQALRMMAGAG